MSTAPFLDGGGVALIALGALGILRTLVYEFGSRTTTAQSRVGIIANCVCLGIGVGLLIAGR